MLRFYLDLSEPEIAAAMGISPGTVKSTTSRALAALGRLLGGEPMNTIEDRLRAAVQAAAGTVAPGSAPPLNLPGQPGRPGGARASAPQRLAALGRPAGRRRLGHRRDRRLAGHHWRRHSRTPAPGRGRPHTGPRPAAPETRAERAAALASVPPYYLTLTGYSGQPHRRAVIRASATGAVLATVAPPAPYGTFSYVSGAADDRTFALGAQRWVRCLQAGKAPPRGG